MVSYYDKGRWAAVVLEILLRRATRGRRGISDLFRQLWEKHGRTNVGITAGDVRAAIGALAGRAGAAAGMLNEFFDRFIDGTEELPVPQLLRHAGLEVRQVSPWQEEDDDSIRRRRLRPWTGLTLGTQSNGDRATVRNVAPDSPAWRAGLTFGDEIVAIDGYRVTAGSAARRLADRSPGEKVAVSFFRQDVLRTARVLLAENPDRRLTIKVSPRSSALCRAVRRGWLGLR
jgi:predicted metalloprotease with PDZ domain